MGRKKSLLTSGDSDVRPGDFCSRLQWSRASARNLFQAKPP